MICLRARAYNYIYIYTFYLTRTMYAMQLELAGSENREPQ